MTPTHSSETLREWIGELTEGDRERLCLWGLPSKLLRVAEVEVSRHLLCAAIRFWKPAHNVFRFDRIELMPMLEEVRQTCCFFELMGPAVFMRRDGYVAVLSQLTGLSTVDYKKMLICTNGLVPLLHMGYFDETAKKCAELGDELWFKALLPVS